MNLVRITVSRNVFKEVIDTTLITYQHYAIVVIAFTEIPQRFDKVVAAEDLHHCSFKCFNELNEKFMKYILCNIRSLFFLSLNLINYKLSVSRVYDWKTLIVCR